MNNFRRKSTLVTSFILTLQKNLLDKAKNAETIYIWKNIID